MQFLRVTGLFACLMYLVFLPTFVQIMKHLFEHFGKIILMVKGGLRKPENLKVYWIEFMEQCNDIGIGSLPLVIIISLFIGMVMTVQFSYQLVSPFVPKSIIGTLVRDSAILEFSPTVTCIVLAGVVGSKIASELGNMRVSEQIDALEIMGINSKSYLIVPKILAGMSDPLPDHISHCYQYCRWLPCRPFLEYCYQTAVFRRAYYRFCAL